MIIPIVSNLLTSLEQWSYNGKFFRIARDKFRVQPAIIPVIYNQIYEKKTIPEVAELLELRDWKTNYGTDINELVSITKDDSLKMAVRSKLYQTRVGVLRELHIANNLALNGIEVHKNVEFDIDKNADLLTPKFKTYVQVGHDGEGSWFHQPKKDKKTLELTESLEPGWRVISFRDDFRFHEIDLTSVCRLTPYFGIEIKEMILPQ